MSEPRQHDLQLTRLQLACIPCQAVVSQGLFYEGTLHHRSCKRSSSAYRVPCITGPASTEAE